MQILDNSSSEISITNTGLLWRTLMPACLSVFRWYADDWRTAAARQVGVRSLTAAGRPPTAKIPAVSSTERCQSRHTFGDLESSIQKFDPGQGQNPDMGSNFQIDFLKSPDTYFDAS